MATKRPVYRVVGSTRDLARSRGISERSARRLAPTITGAYRTAKGWRIPLTTREYAKGHDVSLRTAQRRSVKISRLTPRGVILAQREKKDRIAYDWFKEGGNKVLAKELHNTRRMPGQEGFAYTLVVNAPPDIWVSQTFVFKRRMTPAGLRRHWRVKRWLGEIGQSYDIDTNQLILRLRGAYRHGKDTYYAETNYYAE